MASKFTWNANVHSPTSGPSYTTHGDATGTDDATEEDTRRRVLSELGATERSAEVTVTKVR